MSSLSPLSGREGAEVAGSTPKPEVQYQPPKKLHNEGRKGRERTNEPPTAAFTAEKKTPCDSLLFLFVWFFRGKLLTLLIYFFVCVCEKQK